MFILNPPAVHIAEVFTTLPECYRKKGVRSIWGEANRKGLETDSFLEGPVTDEAGNLYVCDIPFGRIFRIDTSGNWDLIVEYNGEPNGMKFRTASELLIADYKNGLMICDIQRGEVFPFLERRNTERFKGPNDLTFDSSGNLYFTDQGQSGLHDPSGRVYRLRPNGDLDLMLDRIPSPNGIVLSPDERIMYLAVTRANCIWRGPLMDDGSLSKVGQFFTFNGPSGPDGLAMDESGRLIVANTGVGLAWVLNKKAEPEQIIRSPAGTSLTNLAFGGPDRKTLYCTESVSGSILRIELNVSGMPLHRGGIGR